MHYRMCDVNHFHVNTSHNKYNLGALCKLIHVFIAISVLLLSLKILPTCYRFQNIYKATNSNNKDVHLIAPKWQTFSHLSFLSSIFAGF